MEYYFHDQLRWNLFWDSPNVAAAFLVTLIPFCWVWLESCRARSRRWQAAAVWIGELALLFTLCKTYSRGALVALGLAAACWISLNLRSGNRHALRTVSWLPKIFALVLFMLGTQFSERMDMAYLQADRSISNRLDVWNGGMRMIQHAPWTGWGGGRSGEIYMNWYQALDQEEGYRTLVSGWITLAAEFGLLAAGLVFFLLALVLGSAWLAQHPSRPKPPDHADPVLWCNAAACCIVAFATVNIFSTVGENISLWVLPTAALLLLVWLIRRPIRQNMPALAVFSAGAAAVYVFSSLAYGAYLNRDHPVYRPQGGTVLLERQVADGAVTAVVTDPEVLGPTPGRELRHWLKTTGHAGNILVFDKERLAHRNVPHFQHVLWFGDTVQMEQVQADHYTVIHPWGDLADSRRLDSIHLLVLPGLRIGSADSIWRKWAAQNNHLTRYSSNCSRDIRPVWPEIMKPRLQTSLLPGQ